MCGDVAEMVSHYSYVITATQIHFVFYFSVFDFVLFNISLVNLSVSFFYLCLLSNSYNKMQKETNERKAARHIIQNTPKETLLFGEMFQLNLLIMLSVSTDLVCKTPFLVVNYLLHPRQNQLHIYIRTTPGKKAQKCFRTI